MILTVSVFLLFGSACTSLVLWFFLGSRASESRSGRLMGWLMVTTGSWALFNALELVAPTLDEKLVLANLQYAAIVALPVLWFRFGTCLLRNDEDSRARLLNWDSLVWVVPVVTGVLVWLDPWLGLVRKDFALVSQAGVSSLDKEFGPWFWVHSAYSYGFIIAGTVRVIQALSGKSRSGRLQAGVLVLAALIPAAANLLYLAGLWPLEGVDPTPIAFTLTGLMFVLNLSRFRFLALMPAAQDAVVASLDQGIVIVDPKNRVVFVNAAAIRELGLSRLDAGRTLEDLAAEHPYLPPRGTDARFVVQGTEPRTFEARWSPVRRNGTVIAAVCSFRDVTAQARAQQELEEKIQERTKELTDSHRKVTDELERRRETEKQLFFFSLHDALIGLPNRSLLLNRLGQAIERLRRSPEKPFAILIIDFDNFKLVNDSYGHAAGDAFLREATARLLAAVRAVDTVARLGGDEFAVLLDRVNTTEEAVDVADRIAQDLSVPIRYGENAIVPSASVGVLPGTPAYALPEDLLRDADLAMYHAKAAGKNRRMLFEVSMRQAVLERTQITNDLGQAILKAQIELNYQPIVRLSDRAVVGCEALARWNHPVLGRVAPDKFIPLAEETGQIVPLGLFVLMEACRTAALMRDQFPGRECFIAVNVSAVQLVQPDFSEVLIACLGHPPGDHRERAGSEVGTGAAPAGGAGRPRLPFQARRLRHRVLVAGVPAPVPHPDHQGRPGVCVRDDARHPQGHHVAGARAGQEDRRRGHRDRAAGRAARVVGLRLRAGLPVRQAHGPRSVVG
jgi:diguanylate cyclase (GGDEF)-like protein